MAKSYRGAVTLVILTILKLVVLMDATVRRRDSSVRFLTSAPSIIRVFPRGQY